LFLGFVKSERAVAALDALPLRDDAQKLQENDKMAEFLTIGKLPASLTASQFTIYRKINA
jgi:hypothetical protein